MSELDNNIDKHLKLAFEKMLKNKPLNLSKVGKEELNNIWEESDKNVWHVQAVLSQGALTICSDDHKVMDNAPLNWFIWENDTMKGQSAKDYAYEIVSQLGYSGRLDEKDN
jgi:hypothetical protein